ncbi:MAG: type VI secretion system protein [Planctomycetes bacterium]|nr:type VI secretion system protein [Planctomycetota bacterium]
MRSRPDDPVNGVVWCFTAGEVLAAGADFERDLSALWQATPTVRRKAGVGFPLYAVVSGEGLAGFPELCAGVPDQTAAGEVVGWARQDGDDWRDAGADNAVLIEWLSAWVRVCLNVNRDNAARDAATRDALYLLPNRCGRVVDLLVEAMARSAPSAEETADVDMRGVFLVGLPDANEARDRDTETLVVRDAAPPRREAFTRSLFREKIHPERWLLAQSAERTRTTHMWTRRLALSTALCLLLVLVVRLLISTGLDRMAEGPLRTVSQTENYRRWLLAGAIGAPPSLGDSPVPPPIAVDGLVPVLPELPEIYRENMEKYLPDLLAPGWFWQRLFRINTDERAAAARAATALGGDAVLGLAADQVALPLRLCFDKIGGDVFSGGGQNLVNPVEFNYRHPPESLPVQWRYLEENPSDGEGIGGLFADEEEWTSSVRGLRRWLRAQQDALDYADEVSGLPDRYARKRMLDASHKARELSEKAYRPWLLDAELEAFLDQPVPPDAGTLWQAMREWKRQRNGGWDEQELARVDGWLERPPDFDTSARWLEEWTRAAEIWRDRPDSPLYLTALTLWRRALFASLTRRLDSLPRSGKMIDSATTLFAFSPAPLPRIPLSALASASYDPVWRFRPEIWRTNTFAQCLDLLRGGAEQLAGLVQAGLLDEDYARILRQTRFEPVRLAVLAHARSYADYWITDIAMLANPSHWLIQDRLDEELIWMEDVPAESELTALHTRQRWSDFHASLAMVDARDLTRRLLAELTQRRIDALTVLREAVAGMEDAASLSSRLEFALVAMTEDAKLYATPEFWNAAAMTLRAWRSLGKDAHIALERIRRTLARPESQGVWESFFPVLSANFFAPETGEPVKLRYWRGFVLAALNLIQAETQQERWRSQRNLLLRINTFPWRRDAPRTPGPVEVATIRDLLREVGFVESPHINGGQDLPDLPGDTEIQRALRGLFAGLGWGSDWLPPCNRQLAGSVNRLAAALSRLEEWEFLGGVPLIILPQRLQSDPRFRHFRAFVLHQGRTGQNRPGLPGATLGWEMPAESNRARWAWRVKDQLQMRLSLKGAATFDFYNQTVPVPRARIGQARIPDEIWPILSLLLADAAQARPYPEALVEADEPVTVWRARLPVRGFTGGDAIWWDFAFALPAVFGPETPGGVTLLDAWPSALEWQMAVEEWNGFVRNDPELRIPLASDAWKLNAGSEEAWSEFPEDLHDATSSPPINVINGGFRP